MHAAGEDGGDGMWCGILLFMRKRLVRRYDTISHGEDLLSGVAEAFMSPFGMIVGTVAVCLTVVLYHVISFAWLFTVVYLVVFIGSLLIALALNFLMVIVQNFRNDRGWDLLQQSLYLMNGRENVPDWLVDDWAMVEEPLDRKTLLITAGIPVSKVDNPEITVMTDEELRVMSALLTKERA